MSVEFRAAPLGLGARMVFVTQADGLGWHGAVPLGLRGLGPELKVCQKPNLIRFQSCEYRGLLRAALQLRGIAAVDLFDGLANVVDTAAFEEPDRPQCGEAVIELDAEPATAQFLGGLTGRV
jgi:hypothetical protein